MNVFHGLPVPAADFSGALSVLYFFDGIQILCSAGSCAKSYMDFDEFRPYLKNKLYSTKMKMIHAVTGQDNFCEVVLSTGFPQNTPFFSLVGTAVPSVIGMDLEASAKQLEHQLGIPVVWVNCDGFHSYEDGVSAVLLALGKKSLKQQEKVPESVNLIGYSPLTHGEPGQLEPIRKLMKDRGIQLIADWSEAKNLKELAKSTQASLNLVLSAGGLALAEYMKEVFDIPYELICPVGTYGLYRLENILHRYFNTDIQLDVFKMERTYIRSAVVLGEPLFSEGMGEMLKYEFGIQKVYSVSWEISSAALKLKKWMPNVKFMKIDDLVQKLSGLTEKYLVVGDPLFKRFANNTVRFMKIPDRRLSGKLFPGVPWIGNTGSEYIKRLIKSSGVMSSEK